MLLSSLLKSLIVYLYYLKKIFYSEESIISKPCELENINFQLINNDSENQLYQNFPLFIAKPQYSFKHSISSGDSSSHSSIFWTRITPKNKVARSSLIPIFFVLSNDECFNEVILSGVTYTNSLIDFTIKLHIRDLNPDTTYYYKFYDNERLEITSDVGISRTLPKEVVHNISLAVTDSNKNFPSGDFLLQLNDYKSKYFTRLKDYRYRYSKEIRSSNKTILFGSNPKMYQRDFLSDDYTQALLEWFPIRPPKKHLHGKFFDFGDVLRISIFDNHRDNNTIAVDEIYNKTDLIYSRNNGDVLKLQKINGTQFFNLREGVPLLNITNHGAYW